MTMVILIPENIFQLNFLEPNPINFWKTKIMKTCQKVKPTLTMMNLFLMQK